MTAGRVRGARAIALVGPPGAGKTTLAEALLFAAGAIERQGAVQAGATIGDSSPEARARQQSVELNVATFAFMDDRYTLLDCPGSVEFVADVDSALPGADLAVVVADSDPDKAVLLQPILHQLDALGIPRMIFVNKVDQAKASLRAVMSALQTVSAVPLVARQLPILDGERVTGYVDLALERAYVYRPGAQSARIDLPADIAALEHDARFAMLERLADYDDALMEQLLADESPDPRAVFADLAKEMKERLIAPVFFGSAFFGNGMRRLLKALRHETPEPAIAAARLGAPPNSAYVVKTSHAGPAGKLAIVRAFGGIQDGAEAMAANGEAGRVSGIIQVFGAALRKTSAAQDGDVVALAKLESAATGDVIGFSGAVGFALAPAPRQPVYALAIATRERKDDVRLSAAMAKLLEEDATLAFAHDPESGEALLAGQGEMHLRVTLDRMKRRFGIAVDAHRPSVPYRETIRGRTTQRGRHKKQSGGHGQFGDVVVEIAPGASGSGFSFTERIAGGVVPRQWIPAVEMGARDACERGPLGFRVVDVAVTLIDGSHHAVDSSEIAFRTAGRVAIADGLKACAPYLLEPLDRVAVFAPSSATARITAMLSARRGQILGFDAREDWPGWDRVEAILPQSERADLIVELRSITQGLGFFEATFSHFAELNPRLAQDVVTRAKAALA